MPVSVIVAIDPKDGRQLWKTKELKNYTGASFSVKGDRAVYQTAEGMFCLDSKTGEEIMQLFRDIHDQGNTIILVTHEEYIAAHASRVVRLLDGHIESDHLNSKH